MRGTPVGRYEDEHIELFTDGSGGRHSSDARLRRCAWAWVCPRAGSNTEVLHGARGSLGGKQTVPRAELTAIHECLSDILHHPKIKRVTIHSDCKMAVDSFAKGKHTPSSQYVELYGQTFGKSLINLMNRGSKSKSERRKPILMTTILLHHHSEGVVNVQTTMLDWQWLKSQRGRSPPDTGETKIKELLRKG